MTGRRVAGFISRLWTCWQCQQEVPGDQTRCPNCN